MFTIYYFSDDFIYQKEKIFIPFGHRIEFFIIDTKVEIPVRFQNKKNW